MRKVFFVLLALSLSGLLVSCSEDENTVTPTPTPPSFGITTSALPAGYTCTPYNIDLQATGGSTPYSWALATGSTLPTGISLSAEGKILGVLDAAGSYTFSVVCTDAAGTPHTDEVELTLDIEVPASPAVAIYYDGEGTVCQTETPAFTALDCYVFIMLDEQECDCTYGTEFKLQITDVGGVPLVSGTQFAHSYVDYPDNVVLTMGDPFGGLAVSYAYPQLYTNGPIEVVAFGLLLFEDLENLSFDVMANPTSEWNSPVVTHCDPQRTVEEVVGRSSALNYNQQ